MKLKGLATLLFNSDGLHLTIEDDNSGIDFVEIRFNEKQTCQLLSRLSSVSCDMEIKNIEKVGKKMEISQIEFEVPEKLSYENEKEVAYEKAKEYCLRNCESGWIPDDYFGSQGSFFSKEGRYYARCTIRRWI
jgi:hypothetical protein